MDITHLSEDFLHHIWNLQSFDKKKLKTIEGDDIEIINKGIHNHDAGPDFFSSKIKIGKTTWAGNVEIHINSSDWLKHQHQKDPNYDNVILHVVFNHDKSIKEITGKNIPTLAIKNRIPQKLFENYLGLKSSKLDFPCQEKLPTVPELTIIGMIEKAAVERIEEKTKDLIRIFDSTEGDWEECFYILLSRYFGARVNADAFERLARSTPLKVLLKHKNDPFQIEALLLGQSGLLPSNHENTLVQKWIKEYSFLRSKYNLQPLPIDIWKFARMRPISFPTIRISQLANLIHKEEKLFSYLLSFTSNQELKKLFSLEGSPFWDDHFHFNKESESQKKKLGKDSRNTLLINAMVPMLYFYGEKMDLQDYKNKAISLLESLKSENNKVIRLWKDSSVSSNDALQSQGLIQLKKTYCDHNRCLQCKIGNHILNNL